jgi:hypothetical protein
MLTLIALVALGLAAFAYRTQLAAVWAWLQSAVDKIRSLFGKKKKPAASASTPAPASSPAPAPASAPAPGSGQGAPGGGGLWGGSATPQA